MIAGRGKDGRHEGRDTNRRDKRGKEDCEGNGGGRERERGGGEKDRERKREVVYPGQNNYLPFLHAGGTFSPLKTWEGEPPLEVCELPPTEHTRTYTHMLRAAFVCVCTFYIHRGIPHPLDEHYHVPMRPR